MKISIAKKEISPDNLIIGITFFGIVGFVFFIYDIDFSLLALTLILFIYARFIRRVDNLPNYLDLSILAAIGLLIPLLTVITLRISGYGIVAIGFAMLVTLLFNSLELSLLFIIFITSISSAIDGGNFNLRVVLFISSLSAAMLTFKSRRRFQIIRAGLIAGVIQFAVAFLMEREQSSFVLSGIDLNLLKLCLLNGIISSGVVLGFLPVFEYIFKVVTDVSLLELSDFNHPLLRKLILEAPGTYQHSLVVANLSEAASESIGANPLLARVGSYYHDIGKMIKPDYFVENVVSYRDVHKNLKPSMSKIIIFNHVKDGIDLAKKYRLNPKIIDFISQHHGRTLVYYFYQRAKEIEPEGMREEDYRYPGPKPQIKETAIVGLADTIEALSRTLEDPTPSRIEEMVREVVKKRFMEGELDECDLTLKDIEKITQSFTRILNAIFHTRVNYPKDENRNNKPPKNKESKS